MTPESGLAAILLLLGLGGRPGDKPVDPTVIAVINGTLPVVCRPELAHVTSSPRAIRAPRVGEP